MERLLEFFGGEERALDITPDRARAFHRYRHQQGAKAATIRNELATLGRGLTLAFEAGKLPQRGRLPMPRVSNARSGFFTDKEVAAVLAHLPPQMRALVECAYVTGWRRAELCGLRWSQVDWNAGVLRLQRGTTKSGEPRSFPFVAYPGSSSAPRRPQTDGRDRAPDRARDRARLHAPGRRPLRGWYFHSWRKACENAGLEEQALSRPETLSGPEPRQGGRQRTRSDEPDGSQDSERLRSLPHRRRLRSGRAVRKLASMQMADDSPRRSSRTVPARLAFARSFPTRNSRSCNAGRWRPQRDSNPCRRRERAVS